MLDVILHILEFMQWRHLWLGLLFLIDVVLILGFLICRKRRSGNAAGFGKWIIAICVASFFLVCLGSATWYMDSHTVSPYYNDWWIIGKNREEIVVKYGEFSDYTPGPSNTEAYNLGDSDFYVIYFNEDGIAEKVDLQMGF